MSNIKTIVRRIGAAHRGFQTAFRSCLERAKEAGDALRELKKATGAKHWKAVYATVREAGIDASDPTLYRYKTVAERWEALKLVAGEELSDYSLTTALGKLSELEGTGKVSRMKSGTTEQEPGEQSQEPGDRIGDTTKPTKTEQANDADPKAVLTLIKRRLSALGREELEELAGIVAGLLDMAQAA